MTVFTFYEPIPGFGGDSELLEVWRQSWQKAGWRPVVLGMVHAQQHSRFEELHSRVRFLAGEADLYEWHCFARWLALECNGGGLQTDYDVVNYGWPPTTFAGDLVRFNATSSCALFTTARGARQVVQQLFDYEPVPGKGAIEMWAVHTFCSMPGRCGLAPGVLEEVGDPEWQHFPVVHYCTRGVDVLGSCRKDKVQFIQQVRPL